MRQAISLGRDNNLVWFSLFVWGLGTGLYQFVWPNYIKSLGATAVEVGIALAFTSVVSLLLLLPAGVVADRYSRKKNMIVSWALGAASALVYIFAQDWHQLLIGIALMSASNFCNPALSSYVAEAGKSRELGQTFTLVFTGVSLGMVISPPIGGLMMESGGIRSLFYVSFLMYALSTVAICLIREQPVSLQVSVMERGYRGILLNRRIIALFAFFFAVSMSSFLGRSFAAIYLQEVSEFPLSTIGSLGSALAIGAVVLSPTLGLISTKQGVMWALLAAEVMLFAGHSVFLGFSGVTPAVMAYFLWGSSMPIASLSQAIIGKELKGDSVGRGFALQGIVMNLATIVAPYTTGWLYTARPELPFLTMLVILPLLMIVTIILRRHGVD